MRQLPTSTRHSGENLSSADNNTTHAEGEEGEEREDVADGEVWKLTRREQNVSVVTVIMGWIDQTVGGGVPDRSLQLQLPKLVPACCQNQQHELTTRESVHGAKVTSFRPVWFS